MYPDHTTPNHRPSERLSKCRAAHPPQPAHAQPRDVAQHRPILATPQAPSTRHRHNPRADLARSNTSQPALRVVRRPSGTTTESHHIPRTPEADGSWAGHGTDLGGQPWEKSFHRPDTKTPRQVRILDVVGEGGLEPPCPKTHGPEPCASTNSATRPWPVGGTGSVAPGPRRGQRRRGLSAPIMVYPAPIRTRSTNHGDAPRSPDPLVGCHVAFLRAINVGGRRVTNDELAAAVSGEGFGDVATCRA